MSSMRPETVEKKTSVKNGAARFIAGALSALLELVLLFMLCTRLRIYAQWINIVIMTAAMVLVLVIYSQHKTSSMKTPWIILIMAIPVFGVLMYLIIGMDAYSRKMKKRYRDLDDILLPKLPDSTRVMAELSGKDRDACGIAGYISANAGYPVYNDTRITYFANASEGLEAQLEAIAGAQSFVFMEYHAIEDRESWHRIEEVLVKCVERGVEARVFYDDVGSISFVSSEFTKRLRSLGIKCSVFNPFLPGFSLFMNNCDHRKITVVDGRIGFTGGYNLANEYFNVTHPYGEWKDTGIMLEGPAVRSLTVTFLEMWNAAELQREKDTDPDRYLPDAERHPESSGYIQPYADSPLDGEQVGEEVYISMVEKADRYCWFTTPYLIITDEMIHAMGLAAKRGVDVRIVTPGIPDKKLIYSVTRSFYNSLARNGVRIFEWKPGFIHAKMSIADDKMATCGTINLDYRSLYHHFENGCFFYGCGAVRDMKEDFESIFAECEEVTERYSDERSAGLRLGQLFLRLFAALM